MALGTKGCTFRFVYAAVVSGLSGRAMLCSSTAPSTYFLVRRAVKSVQREEISPVPKPLPDLAVQVIRLFEQLSLGFSESNSTNGCLLGCN